MSLDQWDSFHSYQRSCAWPEAFYLKCLSHSGCFGATAVAWRKVHLKLRSVKQSSLFLLARHQWCHCPPSECDLNLTWMEFCLKEDFQPARRETRCSKLLFHCGRFFIALRFATFASQHILLVSFICGDRGDLIILFIGLLAITLSWVL